MTQITAEAPKADSEEKKRADRAALQSRLDRIGRKIVVLSGKGGVGKSTVSVNLAMALQRAGNRVGLLDVDIHGPSVPTMLGLEGVHPEAGPEGVRPVDRQGLRVMSLGFLLHDADDAVIWRGPRKTGAIRQFLKDVAWGDLDFLIIDAPPGTGDEPLSVCRLVGRLDGAVVVTTPQKVAVVDVRKSITFCRRLAVPVLGVVENMSGFRCPGCGQITAIFGEGGGRRIADGMNVPYLGAIPMDVAVARSGDAGRPFVESDAGSFCAGLMGRIVEPIAALRAVGVPKPDPP